MKIRWEPVLDAGVEEGDSEKIKYGKITYELGPIKNTTKDETYTYAPQTSAAIDIDKTFNTRYSKTNWDRTVYWGYTGGGHTANNGTMANKSTYWYELAKDGLSSPASVMVTKLPFEADIDVSRQVKKVTSGETSYQEKTTAHVGDIVEYKVNIANKVMANQIYPLRNLSYKKIYKRIPM